MRKLLITILFLLFAVPVFTQSVTEEWVSRYNNMGNSHINYAKSMAVDNSGNVYVTGMSRGFETVEDYATIKYNSSGIEQWVQRYNGPTNGNDQAEAIAVDHLGNVYVTGMTGGDYGTIKYNSDGIQQWVAKFNGTGNNTDHAYSIAVDSSGNVFVTGVSMPNSSSTEYVTIKYNSDGIQQWVARYNGPSGSNYAKFIAIDGSGNVYVTGYSKEGGINGNLDYVTIKYSSNGVEQWVAKYNGTGNGEDIPNSLAVDNLGNVYVTGYSTGSGTNTDYATIKYNSSGVQQWVQRYNGPSNSYDQARSLAIDDSGNVYVTGNSPSPESGGLNDYATIKYNSDGIEQWVARYYSTANNNNFPSFLAVDGSGNVYVTGSSSQIGTGRDYATIKYNSDGIQQWFATYNGPTTGQDYGVALAVDNLRNVYVTGISGSNGFNNDYDYATIKYSQSEANLPPHNLVYNKYLHTISWIPGSSNAINLKLQVADKSNPGDFSDLPVDSSGQITNLDSMLVVRTSGFDKLYRLKVEFGNNIVKFSDSVLVTRGFFLRNLHGDNVEAFNIYAYSFRNFTNTSNNMWPENWWSQFAYNDPSKYDQSLFGEINYFTFPDFNLSAEVKGYENSYISYPNIPDPQFVQSWKNSPGTWGGSCFGFTSTALLSFSKNIKFNQRFSFFADSLAGFASIGDSVRRMINYMQIQQRYGKANFGDINISATPNEVLSALTDLLAKYRTIKFGAWLSIVIPASNGNPRGSHAVIPYAVEKVSNNVTYIYIYDSNFPLADDMKVEVNTSNNTYRISQYSNLFVDHDINLKGNINTIFPPTMDNPFVSGDPDSLLIYSGGLNSMFVINGNDTITGFNLSDSTVINKDYAMLEETDGIQRAPAYYKIPLNNYRIVFTNYNLQDPSSGIFFKYKDEILTGFERKQNVLPGQSDEVFLEGNKLLYMNPDGQNKIISMFTISETSGIESKTSNFFEAKNVGIGSNDSLGLSSDTSGNVLVNNYGDSTSGQFILTNSSVDGVQIFNNFSIPIPGNSGMLFMPDWDSLSNNPLVVLIDHGMNGIYEDTLIVIDEPLPVNLLSFSARAFENSVALDWVTVFESNNVGFDIERRTVTSEPTEYSIIGNVPGVGNSTALQTYTFTDKNLTTGSYEYRLKQIDFNGNIKYYNLGNIISIGMPVKFELSQNYPNPFNPVTKIDFQIPVEGLVKLIVYDVSGREVSTLVNESLLPGYYTYSFNGSNMASGVYFYRLVSENNVMTKRMMLIK